MGACCLVFARSFGWGSCFVLACFDGWVAGVFGGWGVAEAIPQAALACSVSDVHRARWSLCASVFVVVRSFDFLWWGGLCLSFVGSRILSALMTSVVIKGLLDTRL